MTIVLYKTWLNQDIAALLAWMGIGLATGLALSELTQERWMRLRTSIIIGSLGAAISGGLFAVLGTEQGYLASGIAAFIGALILLLFASLRRPSRPAAAPVRIRKD